MNTKNMERVELHCHSNKSSHDGVNSIEEIIAFADMQGMPTVAITDHGSVAGYGEAFSCNQKYNNMKIIQGIEAYVVDDLIPIVENDYGQKLDDDQVVIDVETTGFNKSQDDIIEVGAVKVSEGIIVDRFHRYVNINKPIPEEIEKITGICNADIISAPSLAVVMNDFIKFIQNAYLVAFNMSFDGTFLKKGMKESGIKFDAVTLVDALLLSRVVMPQKGTITGIADDMNIEHKR